MSGACPFICRSCICCERKRVVLRLPVFTACLSKWACGGLGGHRRSNHTQREESRNPGGPLKLMRFYNYCWVYDYCCCSTHTHIWSSRLTYTQPWLRLTYTHRWLRVMRVYYYCVEMKCPWGRKTSWGFLWTLRPPRQGEENTVFRRPSLCIPHCCFKSAVFTLHTGTERTNKMSHWPIHLNV